MQDNFESLGLGEPKSGKAVQTKHFTKSGRLIKVDGAWLRVESVIVSGMEDYLSHCFDNSFDSTR